jgi:hypothetical protein
MVARMMPLPTGLLVRAGDDFSGEIAVFGRILRDF